ncbi:MAG TPA: FHA domain-containing protein [Polyangiaceae bacterium]|nr:FHA domain-containing protein [Polyangiaceae bacterium]
MALTIVIRSGDAKSPPKVTFDSPRVVVGRGEGCEVRLPDPSVSHRHASIRQRGTDYIVLDEGSTNGTFVGPVRLSPQAPRVLKSGDLIRIGRIWLEVLIEQALPTQNGAMATREIALGLVAEALAAQGEAGGAVVSVIAGPDAGKQLIIAELTRHYVLGRAADADLSLEDEDASRRHAEIYRRGDQIWVRDLGSKNGSQLGDVTLRRDESRAWPLGATLRIGANDLRYQDPIAEALAELEQAADEHMAEEDSVDPPIAEDPPVDVSPSAPASVASQRGGAPVVAVPKRGPRPARRKPGWSSTDLMVAFVAIAVLTVSILGIIWLFRGD